MEISTEIIISVDSFLSIIKSIFGALANPFCHSITTQNVLLFYPDFSTPSHRAASLGWEKAWCTPSPSTNYWHAMCVMVRLLWQQWWWKGQCNGNIAGIAAPVATANVIIGHCHHRHRHRRCRCCHRYRHCCHRRYHQHHCHHCRVTIAAAAVGHSSGGILIPAKMARLAKS